MADRAATAKRLYDEFMAPLVTGGDLVTGPPVGARVALALEGGLAAVDPDVRSGVDVARVRVARRLVAIDTLEGPSADEWALAAAAHDLVHALHPDLGRRFGKGAPERLIDLVQETLEGVPPAPTLAHALSRHTFFARLFELTRADTLISWWTGSRLFLGTEPPPRLLAWPELRRVHSEKTHHRLVELPTLVEGPRQRRFWEELETLLTKLPLTDLSTCARGLPAFRWNGANLGLFARPHGRVVALRALAGAAPPSGVDASLGRATLLRVKAEDWESVSRIADVLAERALVAAATELPAPVTAPEPDPTLGTDARYAQAFGALVALGRVDDLALSPEAAQQLTARLTPLAQSTVGRAIAAIIGRVGKPPPDRAEGLA